MHVTLRSAFRPLRSQFVFPTLRRAMAKTERRRNGTFRVTHFSAQFDHLHLIVEADTRAALLAGVRGLSISIARAINQLVNRKGRLWSDRWHGHTLTTPRATRHAIAYVVGNFRKHTRERWTLDPYSSAPYFCGFREFGGQLPIGRDPRLVPQALAPPRESPVSLPHTWLLKVGWRRAGLLSVFAAPSSSEPNS